MCVFLCLCVHKYYMCIFAPLLSYPFPAFALFVSKTRQSTIRYIESIIELIRFALTYMHTGIKRSSVCNPVCLSPTFWIMTKSYTISIFYFCFCFSTHKSFSCYSGLLLQSKRLNLG